MIEALDAVGHVGLGLVSCSIHLSCCSFDLQRGEEALHRGIVPDVACPAHGADDAVAAIGGMQQRIGPSSSVAIAGASVTTDNA
jgi:hypothetical protein